ncbi:MAG: hypothetical protein OEZ59_11805 [Deltaproteobacteria bacterium]|nr:hypothetical protein [Deltaproteobacteria bacterium]
MTGRTYEEGILFDTAYLEPEIHVWVRTAAGALIAARTVFQPLFYLHGPRPLVERALEKTLSGRLDERRTGRPPPAAPLGWTHRLEFWSGRMIPVLACRAVRPAGVVGLVRSLLHTEHRITAYNVDLDPTLLFHSRHGLFPLARVALALDHGEAGGASPRLAAIRALDEPLDTEFRLPPLRTLTLRLGRSPLLPLAPGSRGNTVIAAAGGQTVEIAPGHAGDGLRALAELLRVFDPDVILSERGDETLLPWLVEAGAAAGVDLPLDRAAPPVKRRVPQRGRSITVYGQVLFKAPAYHLLGRWHLDRANSFFIAKAGLEGLVELARLSRLPVQRQARTSGGTAMTAMEIHLALRQNMLVPFIKDQVEDFRSAAALLRADKGGLTYFPPAGLWEDVVELDFSQQYPTIMALHNVSPETMNCTCCAGDPPLNPVPGAGHHTCGRRRGLVPEALKTLLEKRSRYKALLKSSGPEDAARLDARQAAIKWTLVTTFGYQGFKSAKFGHIAAHEAITAWGRETLLVAKETFEDAGYRLLHALTDSLYVHKPGCPPEEVRALAALVGQRTGLQLEVEGRYDWICFPRSRTRDDRGGPPARGGDLRFAFTAATRYFGRFSDGTLKVRGLKVRRHDTPPLVRRTQQRLLQLMGLCRSRAELEAAAPGLREIYREALRLLWSGAVDPAELAITARVSREPGGFRANSPVSLCLRVLEQHGMRVAPGQKLRYVIAGRSGKDPLTRYVPEPLFESMRDYDAAAYQALLCDAFREVAEFLPGASGEWRPARTMRLL